MFYQLITNKLLIVPLAAWAIAQIIKVIIVLITQKRLALRYLVISGGMPSAHSALVAALTTLLAIIDGVGSVTFAISTIFALIVMYDAAGVRQSVGQQSVVMNRILRELRLRRPVNELGRDIREFIGHTQPQVIIGALLGIAVAWLWMTLTGA